MTMTATMPAAMPIIMPTIDSVIESDNYTYNYPQNYANRREFGMKTYTMAELSRKTKAICEDDEPALITSNGKPLCLIFNIEDYPVDEAINDMQDAYGWMSLREIQRRSVERGLDKMTLEEINEEIRQARLERHAREAGETNA